MKRILALLTAAFAGLGAFGETVAAWEGASLAEWTRHVGVCKDVRLADGAATYRVDTYDSQVVCKLAKPFVGRGNHFVELTLKVPCGGVWTLFWGSEREPNFTGSRRIDFGFRNQPGWQTVKMEAPWSGEGAITSLRLDPADSFVGEFSLKSLKVVAEGEELALDTAEFDGVVFDARTDGQIYASVVWQLDSSVGRKVMSFTTAPDGAKHTYWFDFTNPHHRRNKEIGRNAWQGKVTSFRVARLQGAEPVFPAENLRFVKGRPDLRPDLGVTYAGPEEAIPRAGRPLPLEIILRNYGTRPARNLRFEVVGLPAGKAPLDAAELSPVGEVGACEGWDSVNDDYETGVLPNERRFRVRLPDLGAGDHALRLRITADGAEPREVVMNFSVGEDLKLPKASYTPAPKPVKTGKYEVGVFLFPGWDTHLWHGVWSRAPWRKPVLGWYDETDPEVIDWQIKHLVEHGVSFAFVDWYWGKGGVRWHNHWEEAFAKARYRGCLKWALMWCNHCPPGYHSVEDQRLVVKKWLELFADPQYMRIDGKPVVAVWDPRHMDRDLGAGGCRRLLELSREMARAAGYPGIYFYAVRGADANTSRSYLKQFEEWSFDATCVYKYMDNGAAENVREHGYLQYDWVVKTSYGHWRELLKNSRLPFLPSLSTAYDDRPWRGETSNPVLGIDAKGFAEICREAKRFADETGVTRLLLGPLDEWGEGSIGYPNRELGFGMLNAVRDTFGERPAGGWPVDCAPEDVGLGPYLRADDPLRR